MQQLFVFGSQSHCKEKSACTGKIECRYIIKDMISATFASAVSQVLNLRFIIVNCVKQFTSTWLRVFLPFFFPDFLIGICFPVLHSLYRVLFSCSSLFVQPFIGFIGFCFPVLHFLYRVLFSCSSLYIDMTYSFLLFFTLHFIRTLYHCILSVHIFSAFY